MFHHASIVLGGTPSVAGNKISVAGGTVTKRISTLTVGLDMGLDVDGFSLAQDPTRQEIWPGDRKVTADFEISWTDLSTALYDAWKSMTPMALTVDLVGPVIVDTYHYEAHLCIPSLVLDPAKLPPISGASERKKISASGRGTVDATVAKDFGLWIRTSEATL
jgi:hypothetical protein